ncbi:hypothetical protein D3C72_1826560 [compost metagenome]
MRTGGIQHAVRAALGNGAEVRDGDGQEVQHIGYGSAMEVAVGRDAAVREDHRVVDRCGEFTGCNQRGVVHGVADGAGDLRGATQRVGVLNLGVVDPVGRNDRRVGQNAEHVVSAGGLTRVRTQGCVELRQEHLVGA